MLLQQLINGISIGGTYALVGLGFTLMIGVLRVLNMAHPEVVMLGALFGSLLISLYSVSIIWIALLTMAVTFCVGIVIELVCIRPLLKDGNFISCCISTIGASILIQNLVASLYSNDAIPFVRSSQAVNMTTNVFGLSMGTPQLVMLVTSVVVMAGLLLLIHRTKLGLAIRTTAVDHDTAQLMGVNTRLLISLVVGISSALAGLSGVLLGWAYNSVRAFMGINYGLKGLVAMIFGGAGSPLGTIVGGIILGLVESIAIGYISSVYRDAISFGLLTVILLIRPQGLFSSRLNW